MVVYVDDMNMRADVPNGNRVVRGRWSHMVADTHDELMAMAREIGLNPAWIQHAGTPHEHFDLTLSKKKLALASGAQQITWLEMGRFTLARAKAARATQSGPSRVALRAVAS